MRKRSPLTWFVVRLALLTVSLGAVSACKKDAEAWLQEGESALKAYRLDDAERAFEHVLEEDPSSPRALYGLGWIQHLRGNELAARAYFEQCIQVAPDFYGGYKGMGSVHLAMGYYGQAESSLEKAIELRPGEAATYASLGYVYVVTDRLDKAERAFKKARALEPERGEFDYLLAELHAKQGDLKGALELLDAAEAKSIEEEKFRFLARKLRGRVLLRLALEGLPAGEIPALSEAERERRLKWLEQAEKAFQSALSMSVHRDDVQLNRLLRKVRKAKTRLAVGQEAAAR